MAVITYFRSSSYNTHDDCEQRWFLEYNLGWKFPSQWIATDKGTIVHKVLEVLAMIKMGQQNGEKSIVDDVVGKVSTKTYNVDKIVDKAFGHYSKQSDHHAWAKKDLEECREWVHTARRLNDGMFDPMNRTIVAPERHFDFTIDEPWAKYCYYIGDEKIEGQLALKGTIDLITDIGDGMYEIIDWKTGKSRNNWATGQLKEYEDFQKDPQLMFYFYALTKLYPEVHQFVITIYYIRAGGPFTVTFTEDDIPKVEKMIREKFERVRSMQVPKLNKSWKCSKTCPFGQKTFADTKIKPIQEFRAGQTTRRGQMMTMCEQIAFEIQRKGMDRVIREYMSPDHHVTNYKAPGESG